MKQASIRNPLRGLNLTPLAAALLASFSAFAQQGAVANPPAATATKAQAPQTELSTLPDLGSPASGNASIRPGPNGLTIANTFDDKSISVTPEYSDRTGWSVGTTLTSMLGDNAAVGVLLNVGRDKKELLINTGFQVDARQHVIVTVGQLEQFLDYAFRTGTESVGMTQTSGAVNYQLQLGSDFLRFLELNGYVAQTASRELAGKTFVVDTATLYELWNDPRRIAGGAVTGVQARLGFSPITGSTVRVSLGQERLRYDLLAGSSSVDRVTGGIEWAQQLGSGYQFKLAAESYSSQSSTTLALERSLRGGGGRHNIGLSLVGLRGRDGLGDDNQIKLTYTYLFGATATAGGHRGLDQAQAPVGTPQAVLPSSSSVAPSSAKALLRQVAQRPSVIPSHVVAKVDDTALPTRLIAVDKTALPAGTTINTPVGDVTIPLGTAVSSIAGVTKNLSAFVSSGQFSLVGNSLLIKLSQIAQPAVGVIDSYVITINNQVGGTTLVTMLVSHGSVKIDSITVTAGVVADTTAPVTASALSVSGTTFTSTVLSATINEAGTGYYLVQPAAAAAPTVAQVQAGTAFAMAANVAATPTISGLTASTAYKIYFVAKDVAGNVQPTVQNVSLTTAAPDVTAPITTAAPSVFGTADTATNLSVTINEAGTGYYLVQPAAAAAPTAAQVQAGTRFAMAANTATTQAVSGLTASTAYTIYFVAKDVAGNVQAGVQSVAFTTTVAPVVDVTAPLTTGLVVSGTTDTSATFSATINEAGIGYYQIRVAAAAAPTLAEMQAGSSWPMSANGAVTQFISGLTAATNYKIYFVAKDAAGNVQAAVQNVAVTTAAAPDVTPPVTGSGPSVSGTTHNATTLSVTINEAGTGYYLVKAAAAAAPTVAEVQAGTSFAMTANTAATQAISGLTASTAYKIYFVAKDAAGNVQAAVQNVAVTTTAAPDVTPPVTGSGPSVGSITDTGAIMSVTINEAGTGYFLVKPTIDPAPTKSQVLAGTSFAMTANTAATQAFTGLMASTGYTIYFVAKDAAGNVQATVQTVAFTTAPSGYVVQGGLTWSPNHLATLNWAGADAFCAGTINGQTGWRLPTITELNALSNSGAITGQGWSMTQTWSSTETGAPYLTHHQIVHLDVNMEVTSSNSNPWSVTCVR